MSRRGQSVTLSLRELEKAQLEELALEFGCEWGDRPNISKLIQKIAKRELKIAPNNDWQLERINALERIRIFLIDAGQIDEAIALAQILSERSELENIALRQEIEKFLQQPLPPWRQKIDNFIRRQQPFQLSYQDPRENTWTFSIHHAQIVTHEKRQYLDCWATETEGNLDLPKLQHNWSLRLDRIQDAAVSPLNEKWRSHLDSISVELHLYRGLAFAYQGKSTDVYNDWHPELPKTRQVIRQVTSTFWFFREILPYGKDCKIIGPQSISDLFKQDLEALYQMYHPKH
ncbi:WYL domain-containing protein [Picosynechococcus sp. PCC 8807]|uniref:WYL domain-containing protein n=1 Tax=Picosynechococcus sp. PCC 8807 TaxID=195248 RepID=UPI0008107315|nr:WYL domain-containing protein [Picosynechococcus sp. PCC 8807]ANV92121.1 WYL domain-containing protein [Picosynechococcus sp. PCC 8807]